MPLVYRTAGVWGPGKGSNLSPTEVDENFRFLHELILSVQDATPEPDEISNIVQNTPQTITIYMASGATWGPFTLPRAVAETIYAPMTVDTTLPLSAAGKYYRVTGNVQVTIPPFSSVPFPVNTEVHFRLASTGTVLSFQEGSGVTLHGMESHSDFLSLRGGVVTLKKWNTNNWDMWGYLDLLSTASSSALGSGS